MKRHTLFVGAMAALSVSFGAPLALACGAFCPRDGSSGLLSLGILTAVGVIGAAWILARKPDERG